MYFAFHDRKQGNSKIIIRNVAYIGMRASVVASKGDIEKEERAIVGAMTLVNKSVPAVSTAVGVHCRILEKK